MKKLFSLFFAIIILISSIPVAEASNHSSSREDDMNIVENHEIQQVMLRILSSIEHEKELYGLENVDFSNVEIGSEIPTYITCNNELQFTDTHIFPVLADGQIISLFYISKDENEWGGQLSNALAAQINELADNSACAIVYDNTGAYLFANGRYHLLLKDSTSSNPHTKIAATETRTPIELVSSDILDDSCSTFNIATSLNVNDYMTFRPTAQSATAASLAVDLIKQPSGSNYCWACSIASIANYLYDYKWSYMYVANVFNGGVDEPMSLPDIIQNFNLNFNADYAYKVDNTPSLQFVVDELADFTPLLGAFIYGSIGHAVVIRGASIDSNTFSVMDPGTGTYVSGTVYQTSGKWRYTSESSTTRFSLYGYGYYNG